MTTSKRATPKATANTKKKVASAAKSGSRATAAKTKKATSQKTVAKKAVAKKAVAKRAVAKKAVAKKTVAKEALAKSVASKAAQARKSTTSKGKTSAQKGKSAVLKAVKDGDAKIPSKSQKKISVAEKLSTSHLVKKQPRTAGSKPKRGLKLVKKGPIKVPATKISRSDSYSGESKVITGRFSFGEEETKPLVVRKAPVEGSSESRASGPVIIFKTGDKIVYPGHGVGEIEGIRSTVLDGQEHHIYNITILESGMKVMVPVSQASAVGLRKIIDKRAIEEVFTILRDRDFKIDTQTWNRRFREYSQKIKTGSVFEIAVVLRDLSVLSVDKELSFGEKKMLDMAESLLVSEIALARSRPHDKVVGELRALFTS